MRSVANMMYTKEFYRKLLVMNPETFATIKLECLKIAQQYSKTKEELVKNTIELINLIVDFSTETNTFKGSGKTGSD